MQNRNTYFEPPLERNVKLSLYCFCTGGTHGDVSVRVRTIGGGESWQGSVTLRPSDVSNTIEKITYQQLQNEVKIVTLSRLKLWAKFHGSAYR